MIEEEKSGMQYYAIMTSSKNPIYMFPLPITVLCWKRLGVQSIVILVGLESEFVNDPVYDYILNILKNIGAHIEYIHSNKIPESTISQTIRLYAPILPFASKFNPFNSIFITTDADMLTFNLSQHIPDIKRKEKLKIYNSRAYKFLTSKMVIILHKFSSMNLEKTSSKSRQLKIKAVVPIYGMPINL
uniref:Uncharacterized protein n=1 Tax=Acrobeloides nanus TaxID=290746 RepID=A0A914DIF6_9BILA